MAISPSAPQSRTARSRPPQGLRTTHEPPQTAAPRFRSQERATRSTLAVRRVTRARPAAPRVPASCASPSDCRHLPPWPPAATQLICSSSVSRLVTPSSHSEPGSLLRSSRSRQEHVTAATQQRRITSPRGHGNVDDRVPPRPITGDAHKRC